MKYDASVKVGYVATTRALLDLAVKTSRQKVDFRMAYVYRDAEKGRESVYFVGVLSEADDWKFLKSNNLTIIADNQKIVLGNARRLSRRTANSSQELLLYKINRSAIARIANAKSLEVKLGMYYGDLSDKLRLMIKKLLQVCS